MNTEGSIARPGVSADTLWSAALNDSGSAAFSSAPDLRLDDESPAEICVMVVEDDVLDRKLYRRALAQSDTDYAFHEFDEPEAALQAVEHLNPDCILLDMNLPTLSGLEFLSRLGAMSVQPSVVMVTAHESRGLGVKALKLGAADFLNKDELGPSSLERAIRHAAGKKQQLRMKSRLKQAEKLAAVGQVAAGVAHEVNNPAAFVMMNLDLIKQVVERSSTGNGATLDAAQVASLQEMLADSREGIERIATIVRELRVHANAPLDGVVSCSLDKIVHGTKRLLRSRLLECKGAEFELASSQVLNIDRGKLTQVVVNLVVNALQAAGPSGQIFVKTVDDGDSVLLTVEDDGPGISNELRERVFEPFFSTKTSSGGMGLGLALSREYVTRHGGEIEITRSSLGGACFRVKIPVNTGLEPSDHASAPATRNRLRSSKAKVLIVDDELSILRAYERILRDEFDVFQATEVEVALKLTKATQFDVIICDVVMRDGTGPELLEQLSKTSPTISERFIFCTGGAIDDQSAQWLDSTTAGILRKPLGAEQLLAAVRKILPEQDTETD